MNKLSTRLTKSLATAVITAAALGNNAMAATCAAKCTPKKASAACKAGASKTKAKCGACKAKCGACKAGKCGACGAKK